MIVLMSMILEACYTISQPTSKLIELVTRQTTCLVQPVGILYYVVCGETEHTEFECKL